jgi:hypothetical protein
MARYTAATPPSTAPPAATRLLQHPEAHPAERQAPDRDPADVMRRPPGFASRSGPASAPDRALMTVAGRAAKHRGAGPSLAVSQRHNEGIIT